MLLLALSDAHIPERAIDLPAKFKKLLSVPKKISQVVLLGNCTKSFSFLQFVNQISSNVVIVRGEFDTGTIATTKNAKEDIPINTIIKQGDFRIGCCNGYTIVPKSDPLSLLTFARQLDVDIVLWGGTHNVEAYTLEGKFFINPGSCTGAFSTDWPIQETERKVEEPQSVDIQKQDEGDLPEGENEIKSNETDETDQADQADEEKKSSENTGDADKTQEAHTSRATNENTEDKTQNDVDANPETSDDDEDIDELDINGGCIPSFCLLDIQGPTCTLFIYTCVDGEVKVDKVVYKKE